MKNIYKITKTSAINDYDKVRFVQGKKNLQNWLHDNSNTDIEKIESVKTSTHAHGCRVSMEKIFNKNSDKAVLVK